MRTVAGTRTDQLAAGPKPRPGTKRVHNIKPPIPVKYATTPMWMTAVYRSGGASKDTQALALPVYHHANSKTGLYFAADERVAGVLGVTTRTVERWKTSAVRDGFLIGIRAASPGKNAIYRMCIPCQAEEADYLPPTSDIPVGRTDTHVRHSTHARPTSVSLTSDIDVGHISEVNPEYDNSESSSGRDDDRRSPSKGSTRARGAARGTGPSGPGDTSRPPEVPEVSGPPEVPAGESLDAEDIKAFEEATTGAIGSWRWARPDEDQPPFTVRMLGRDRDRVLGMISQLYDEEPFTADELVTGMIREGMHNPDGIRKGAAWVNTRLREADDAMVRGWVKIGREWLAEVDRKEREEAEQKERVLAERPGRVLDILAKGQVREDAIRRMLCVDYDIMQPVLDALVADGKILRSLERHDGWYLYILAEHLPPAD
jgi:hypothetical protein